MNVKVNADVCANRVLIHWTAGSSCRGRIFNLGCSEGEKREEEEQDKEEEDYGGTDLSLSSNCIPNCEIKCR